LEQLRIFPHVRACLRWLGDRVVGEVSRTVRIFQYENLVGEFVSATLWRA